MISLMGLRDRFDDEVPPGKVIGSCGRGGTRRLGFDAEGSIGIDHGALRIPFLHRTGWGRAALAYGPYARTEGLTMAVFMLNGHNTSETHLPPEGRKARLRRWARDLPRLRFGRRYDDDNLAVGWFPSTSLRRPTRAGHAFVMHAAGPRNGELWAAGAPRFDLVMNLPMYFVVALRSRGAAFYAATVDGDPALPGYPALRPLAIDPWGDESELHAAVHQAALGQVGFTVDSRVYGVAVDVVDEMASWCGTAVAADRLSHGLPAPGALAERGGVWHLEGGDLVLHATEPAGLVHAVVHSGTDTAPSAAGLVWRGGERSAWRFTVASDGARVEVRDGDRLSVVARDDEARLGRGPHALQVVDDGARIAAYLDARRVFDLDAGPAAGSAVGVIGPTGSAAVSRFEAHPRLVRLPAGLDLGGPWSECGTIERFTTSFGGADGDLAAVEPWERTLGAGAIEVAGGAARVRASVEQPNPGRTAYTVPWGHRLADLRVTMTPPGSARGQGERGRGGLVLWQDDDNYVIVSTWLDDWYEGTSISSFYRLGGEEDLYRAVWSNIGRLVTWGVPYTLRVVSDGARLSAFVDGRPVLHRALTDVVPTAASISIERVGIVANWEFGDDTGTTFTSFTAMGAA